VEALADFLSENDYMHVTIDGHADPRGDSKYNIELSESRAESVAQILKEAGIEDYRLQTKGHGANFSSSALNSIDDYAQQRRVKIQVFPSKGSAGLASID
jgi:outer membrane protein OmpA-like peptidoglycan-associated protein